MMSWFKRKKKEEFVGEVHAAYGPRPGLDPNQTMAEYELEKRMHELNQMSSLKQEINYLYDREKRWQIRINELEERIIELEKEKKELTDKWNKEVESEW